MTPPSSTPRRPLRVAIGALAVATPSATPPASTTAPPPAPASAHLMMWEGKATFEHFSIEVLSDDHGLGHRAVWQFH